MKEDLIKRSDAIKELGREYPAMPMFKSLREEWAIKTEGYRKAEEVIMRLPSVDRPRGEWIPCTKGGLPLTELGRRERQKWYGYKCSKCNFIYKGNALTESPFCQNCGTRMEKIGEEIQTCELQDGADCTNCNLIGEDKCWDCVIKEE